jgi:hypothetical protein
MPNSIRSFDGALQSPHHNTAVADEHANSGANPPCCAAAKRMASCIERVEGQAAKMELFGSLIHQG